MYEILYHNSKMSLFLSAKMREMLTRFFDSQRFLGVAKSEGLIYFNRRDIEKLFADVFASHERLIGTRFPG